MVNGINDVRRGEYGGNYQLAGALRHANQIVVIAAANARPHGERCIHANRDAGIFFSRASFYKSYRGVPACRLPRLRCLRHFW